MAKKIEVWVNEIQVRRGGDGYDGGKIITNVYEPTHEDGDEDWNAKATLVISKERVFTESEVRAMLDEIHGLAQAYWDNAGHGAPDMLSASEVAGIAERGGILLDPA